MANIRTGRFLRGGHELFRCKECGYDYTDDDDRDPAHDTGLCYRCFEDGVERAEERRRERIARQNEF